MFIQVVYRPDADLKTPYNLPKDVFFVCIHNFFFFAITPAKLFELFEIFMND